MVRNRGKQRPVGGPGAKPKAAPKPSFTGDLFGPRGEDGDGSIETLPEFAEELEKIGY